MRLLLDTNALIWAAARPNLLSRAATDAIADPENTILVSAASAWEIGTKVRLGKLPLAVELERDFMGFLSGAGYQALSITAELGLRAARLPGPHHDPFDRLIAAHALAEDIPLVSADSQLDSFGVRRLW